MNLYHDRTARQQRFDLLPLLVASPVDQRFYDAVRGSIRPVGHWQPVMVWPCVIYIFDHAPWIINIRLTKCIAIIPIFNCVIFVIQVIIMTQFLHLIHLKSKVLIKTGTSDGNNV